VYVCVCVCASNVGAVTEEDLGDDPEFNYPLGLVNFSANCLNIGGRARVTFYWHGIAAINMYRKYGDSSPGAGSFFYRSFVTDIASSMIGGDNIPTSSYFLTDNTFGDDNSMSREITDPTGPALPAAAACSGTIITSTQIAPGAAGAPVNSGNPYTPTGTSITINNTTDGSTAANVFDPSLGYRLGTETATTDREYIITFSTPVVQANLTFGFINNDFVAGGVDDGEEEISNISVFNRNYNIGIF